MPPEPVSFNEHRRQLLAENSLRLWATECPPAFRTATWDTVSGAERALPTNLISAIDAWFKEPQPGSVCVRGGVGVGKTWLACAIAHRAAMTGRSSRFASASDLFERARAFDKTDRYFEEFLAAPLIIIDDIPIRAELTDWEQERLYTWVNRRWLNQLPVIVTTNLDFDVFKAAIGERTYDRLRDRGIGVAIGGSVSGRAPISTTKKVTK